MVSKKHHTMNIVQNSNIKQFCKSLIYKFRYGLTETECEECIRETSNFFGIPMPMLINDLTGNRDDSGTKVWHNNRKSMSDDIFDYDLKELKKLGVHDKVAFSLVCTHETAHRVFQNKWLPGPDLGQWEQELVADYFLGIRAGLQDLDIRSVFDGLTKTNGCGTHPTGKLRGEYMSYGLHLGLTNRVRKVSATINEYLNLFLDYRREHFKELYEAEITIY